MTNTTELAQSLKRRAASANEFGESLYVKADDILALVEALEKAQGMEVYWKTQCRGITDHCEELQACIAELESRTVKLPKLKMLEDYLAEVAVEERKQILIGVKLEFHRELTAAGIKVEAE